MPDRIILIDKPYRWTSFDVVKKLRKPLLEEKKREHAGENTVIKNIKVGHAGTLDPLATGLLVICSGKLTKKIPSFQNEEKEYTGTAVIGARTESYDLETDPGDFLPFEHITPEMIYKEASGLCGEQQQTPPLHSAKKISGVRAYEKARRGEVFEMKSHLVFISVFEITAIRLPEIDFRVVCSKGTYIRSLAHDLGLRLGTGAYLSSLCRTRIGSFHLKNAVSPEGFIAQLSE